MITRIITAVIALLLTFTSCSKEESIETSGSQSGKVMVVTDDGYRPLEIFRAISGIDAEPTGDTYSFEYTGHDGSFRISIEGSLSPDSSHTYATMKLKMTDSDPEKTIIFIDSSHPATRGGDGDVPVIMEE